MPENPLDEEPMDRQDRADVRADRSDSRMDRSDMRADRSDLKAEGEHKTTTQLLEGIESSLLDLDKKIDQAVKDLDEERERDRAKLRKSRVGTAIALFAATLASIAAFSVCQVANSNRATIRVIIDVAYATGSQTANPVSPEVQVRRDRVLKVVAERTEPLNCWNPLFYLQDKGE